MKLTKKDVSGAVVVEVKGKLIGGPDESDLFHGFFRSLLDEGKNKIVVNLGKTPWADSRGLGMLMGVHTSATNAGGELVVSHVEDRLKRLMAVTKIQLLLPSFESDDDAVTYLMKNK